MLFAACLKGSFAASIPSRLYTKPFCVHFHTKRNKHEESLFLFFECKCIKKPQSVRHIALSLLWMYSHKDTSSSLYLLLMQSKIQRKGFPSLTLKLFLKAKLHNVCTFQGLFTDKKVTDWTPPPLLKYVSRVIGTEGFATMACNWNRKKIVAESKHENQWAPESSEKEPPIHTADTLLLSPPPGKMERSLAFLFFSSGAMGSGFELWFSAEESRLLLFILKGGAGGFSSISRLSDIFSSPHSLLQSTIQNMPVRGGEQGWWPGQERGEEKLSSGTRKSLC